MNRCFLTGCDEANEWMLPWFLDNYTKHNNEKLIVADFGLSKSTINWLMDNKTVTEIINVQTDNVKGWFLKPRAMMSCDADEVCWIDTDCEIRGNLDHIFNYIDKDKLTMAIDHPWSLRYKEQWHNSGVVAFQGKPFVLTEWQRMAESSHQLDGDQQVLHWMMGGDPIRRMSFIRDLPTRFNVQRLQLKDGYDATNAVIMHWTGKKGKEKIKELMNE